MDICRRTAQFAVPVTDAKLPERFLDTLGSLNSEQLSLRFDPTTSVNVQQFPTYDANASDRAIPSVGAARGLDVDDVGSSTTPMDVRAPDDSPIAVDLSEDIGSEIETAEEQDDPMLLQRAQCAGGHPLEKIRLDSRV